MFLITLLALLFGLAGFSVAVLAPAAVILSFTRHRHARITFLCAVAALVMALFLIVARRGVSDDPSADPYTLPFALLPASFAACGVMALARWRPSRRAASATDHHA